MRLYFTSSKTVPVYTLLLEQLTERSLPTLPNAPSRDHEPQQPQQSSLRILLAEDNRVNQKVALLLLQQLGYKAAIADNGLAAIAALQQQSYDVILMDVQMPEMDGLSATRYIREHWETATRPRIIAMTANAMTGDREACLKAGMDDYISKPIRIEALAQALKQCCPQPQPAMTSLEPDSTAAIDPEALQLLRDAMGEDASESMKELIDCYLAETPKLLQTLTDATRNHDAVALNQAAHMLKSSSAYLGAIVLTDLSAQLEAIGQTGSTDGSAIKVKQLEAEYERVRTALQQSS